jgi:hypothetical protein
MLISVVNLKLAFWYKPLLPLDANDFNFNSVITLSLSRIKVDII